MSVSIDESYPTIHTHPMTNCGNEHSGTSDSLIRYGINFCAGSSCARTEYSASPWVDHAPSKMKSANHLCSHGSLLIPFISFDLDLPVDCDDEYWDHLDPEKRFKQPPNKPSSVTSFIFFIKLQQVLAFSLRTIVSVFPWAMRRTDTYLILTSKNSIQSIDRRSYLALLDNNGNHTSSQSWTQH